jgi:adenylosuccinate lyase
MPERNLILPGFFRYQPKEQAEFFGYDNLFWGLAKVEIATMEVLAEIGVIPQAEFETLTPELIAELEKIPTTRVDIEERQVTHHDVRAWVHLAQQLIQEKLRRWVHVPLTSYDSLDTGRIWQFRESYFKALKPTLKELIKLQAEMVEKFAGQLQIGRTHGQHALPITVGFWLATILNRVLTNFFWMEQFAQGLTGKLSGAVGAYNAQVGLGFEDLCGSETFERRVLAKLGLKEAPISTQILQPEPLGYYLFSATMLSASLGQFGRDGRQLMRSEIGEIAESFEPGQVGSSTMAQKRNPLWFENTEGMWVKTKNEFGKVLDTLISEHQRDLVGSCVARDFPIIIINLQQQINTLIKKNKDGVPFLTRISVNADACQRNFEMSAGVILAEPMYIALQMAGYPGDAHELVNRKVVPLAQKTNQPLISALQNIALNDETVAKTIKEIPEEILELLGSPQNYTGKSKEKALSIARHAKSLIESL